MPIAQTSLSSVMRLGNTLSDSIYGLAAELRAALVNGLSASQKDSTLSPICSSGNCTFPAANGITYSTIGFSSSCVDMSRMLSQTGPHSWDPADQVSTRGKYVEYNLTSEIGLKYILSQVYPGSVTARGGGRWESMLAMSAQHTDLTEQALEQGLLDNTLRKTPLQTITMIVPTQNPCQKRETFQVYFDGGEAMAMPPVNASSCPQLSMPNITSFPGFFALTAAVCFIYPSLLNLNGSIVNGQVQERLISDPIPMRRASLTTNASHVEAGNNHWVLEVSDPCVIDGILYTATNYSLAPGGMSKFPDLTVPLRCVYGLDYPWYRALEAQNSLAGVFLGGTGSLATNEICAPYSNYSGMMCTGAWWLSGIYNSGNASIVSIQNYMDRGLKSLNNQLRMLGTDWDGNPTNVSGIAYTTKVCVQFRAPWLIFPLCLVAGTLALLTSVIISGFVGGRKEVTWKSSILPHLFYRVENQVTRDNADLASSKELETAAKKVVVDFSVAEHGWGFHAVDED